MKKFQVNFDTKEITIEDEIKLEDLWNLLQFHFPDEVWKEYTLIPKKIIDFVNPQPITAPQQPFIPLNPLPFPQCPQPPYPWQSPIIYCTSKGIINFSIDI